MLVVVLSINLSPLLAQAAQPAEVELAAAAPKVHIIQLQDAPLASYRGGLPGLEATNPGVRGERKLDSSDPASLAYLDYLRNQQALFIQTMEQVLGRPVETLYQYQHAFSGMAVQLTAVEAKVVAQLPGLRMVQQETIEYPLTDRGPAFIGAPGIWDGTATPSGIGSMGEGIIIGVIDTGINHASPSFADVGGDGYDHENPWGEGNYVGVCETDPGFCNDKLIGAWCMVSGDPNDPNCPEDSDGHGSHTSSTAGGNFVTFGLETPNGYVYTSTVSGVAPHANIVMYDACVEGCPGSALLAAADQALIDGVDVINYSISGGTNPYYDSVELAFLALVDAGVYVSTSAGNNGPSAGTVGHRSPWVATTAASTHDRTFVNGLIDMDGDTAPPEDMWGQSVTIGYGPAQIVYVTDTVTNSLCLEPFPPGTFDGEIVVCDRGLIARVDKGANVLAGGAGGLVLVNTSPSQNIAADAHYLPAVHLNSTDGDVLKAWLAGGGTVFTGTIAGSEVVYDPEAGDIVAGFSSRGPNTTFEVLKPDMAAPGVAILAASRSDIGYEFKQGTSMASPHNAGAGALLMAVHPEWSPAEIKSALMTTVATDLISEDTGASSTPFDKGAGRDELTRAALAGLVLHEGEPNYSNANPDLGGDPKTLNLASMVNEQCFGTCTFTRTVSSTLDITSTWQAVDDPQAQFSVTVTPSEFTLPPYGSQTLIITADVEGLAFDEWFFAYAILSEGTLVAEPELGLIKDDGGITVAPGDTITYTLAYTNSGDAPSTGAMLTETLPASTTFNAAASDPGWMEVVTGTTYVYDVGTIDPHTGGSVVFAVDVDAALVAPATITNTAYLGDDYLGMAAWASAATPVISPVEPELGLIKDDGGITVSPGDTIIYTLAYTNSGDAPSIGAMLTETLPASTTFNAAASDPGWMEVVTGTTYVYDVGTIDPHTGGSVAFAVDVDAALVAPATITNTAYLGDDYLGMAAWASDTTPVVLPGYTIYLPAIFKAYSPTLGAVEPVKEGAVPLPVAAPVNRYAAGKFARPAGPIVGLAPDAYLTMAVQPWAPPPLIDVDPETLASSQEADMTQTVPFTVSNVAPPGHRDLEWDLVEDIVPSGILADWGDSFDTYAAGSSMHGQGGWKGWGNDPAATAYVSDAYAQTPDNSVLITDTNDLVHEYSGYTTDQWVYTAWQYIPAAATGESYFILLNTYDDSGATNNWSTQVNFNLDTDQLSNDGPAGGVLPIINDQWVEIRVEIDLVNDIQTFYYGGDLLFTGSWTEGLSGGGALNIGAVDLWGNDAGPVYYDSLSLEQDWGYWTDFFDIYDVGSSMHGQGGWKGWGNDPAYTAYVTDTYAQTPNNSVNVVGNSDLVHEYSGYTTDIWVYTAWQYIPSGFSGESYFILLNAYDDAGVTNNWSTQVNFNSALGQVVNEGASGGTLPIINDQWVEIRVEIDLINDVQTFYYDGQVLYTGTWTEEVSGGGALTIGAVDLFANGASPVFYDTLSLEPAMPDPCQDPSDIPWLSVAPDTGVTPPGGSSSIGVTFDSAGMAPGTYNSTLCVFSNDVITPVIPVPVSLTVTTP
jgi:uncharacterized repeat protein (TIGR01451 family)